MPTQRYTKRDGTVVPGTTSVVGQNLGWSQNALTWWAFKTAKKAGEDALLSMNAKLLELAADFAPEDEHICPDTLQGALREAYESALNLIPNTPYKQRDDAAEVGTLVHKAVEAFLHTGSEEPAFDELDAAGKKQAKKAFNAFLRWQQDKQLDVLATELPLVSEMFSYGGTLDCVCLLDGQLTLLDLKTSKGVYDSHWIQLAAYNHLWEECRGGQYFQGKFAERWYKPFEVRGILKLDKIKGNPEWKPRYNDPLHAEFTDFLHLRHLHNSKSRYQ